MRTGAATAILLLLLGRCTGGTESKAADQQTPEQDAAAQKVEAVDAQKAVASINPAIPIYHGAQLRADLTRRDEVSVRGQYGASAEVYTLATDDSFPQVYHYYTTYLAQFRGFPAQDTYPPGKKEWRTLEVQLNQAMQDPFIPGQSLPLTGKQVILQVAETEGEPKTLIRYIVTPAGNAPPPAVASNGATSDPVTR